MTRALTFLLFAAATVGPAVPVALAQAPAPVYRCPGPPVLYTDALKADKKPALQSRAELEAKFAADVADGVAAAAAGMVDDVIDPAETRKYVIAALEMLSSKRESNPPKKHGNLPL